MVAVLRIENLIIGSPSMNNKEEVISIPVTLDVYLTSGTHLEGEITYKKENGFSFDWVTSQHIETGHKRRASFHHKKERLKDILELIQSSPEYLNKHEEIHSFIKEINKQEEFSLPNFEIVRQSLDNERVYIYFKTDEVPDEESWILFEYNEGEWVTKHLAYPDKKYPGFSEKFSALLYESCALIFLVYGG